jgi:hypothetical protein
MLKADHCCRVKRRGLKERGDFPELGATLLFFLKSLHARMERFAVIVLSGSTITSACPALEEEGSSPEIIWHISLRSGS